jgi:hypothetical protein
MNALHSATKITNINDSVMVLQDGQYKGVSMPVEALRQMLSQGSDLVIWTRKVLVNKQVVEKTLEFKLSDLKEFASKMVRSDVLNQFSSNDMIAQLRK